MDSKKTVIFLVFIASANCLVSDDIYKIVSNDSQCNQSKSVLDSLGINSCRTAGDRGSEDVLCNGIKTVIRDICNQSSHITLEQVRNTNKLSNAVSVEVFCKSVRPVNVLKLPKNISDTLNNMKNGSCIPLCMLMDGTLNQLCPFFVSYIVLKYPLLENVDTTNTNLTKGSGAAMKNNIDKTRPVVPDSVPKQAPNRDTNTGVQPSPIRSENYEKVQPIISDNEPRNKLPPLDNKPSDLDPNPKSANRETELNLSSPKNNVQLENPDDENDRNNAQETNDDGKQTNDDAEQTNEDGIQTNEGGIQTNEGGKQTNEGGKQTNEGGKQTNEDGKQPNEDEKQTNADNQQSSVDQLNEPDSIPNNKAAELETVNISREPFDEAESSNFFTYFVLISALCVFFYVAMYNKKKILALMIEGRRSSVKRRPNSAAYSKLDCTLEEAMASGPSTSSSNTLLY